MSVGEVRAFLCRSNNNSVEPSGQKKKNFCLTDVVDSSAIKLVLFFPISFSDGLQRRNRALSRNLVRNRRRDEWFCE